MTVKDVVIVGAGPYGILLASHLKEKNVDVQIQGKVMQFWKDCMPNGMLLRSPITWDLSLDDANTLRAYIDLTQSKLSKGGLIPKQLFVDYVQWYIENNNLFVQDELITNISKKGENFELHLDNHEIVFARSVIIATGIRGQETFVREVTHNLPRAYWSHCYDYNSFDSFDGKRVCIIGGRQSAFEDALLMEKADAKSISIVYRHDTPDFVESDWDFLEEIVANCKDNTLWFHTLPETQKDEIRKRFWYEGRARLEPWLRTAKQSKVISLYPNSKIQEIGSSSNSEVSVELSSKITLTVDHIMLATGFSPKLQRLAILGEDLRREIANTDGVPLLDSHFESSVNGLFFAGAWAAYSCGPYLGFLRGCPIAARAIASKISEDLKM